MAMLCQLEALIFIGTRILLPYYECIWNISLWEFVIFITSHFYKFFSCFTQTVRSHNPLYPEGDVLQMIGEINTVIYSRPQPRTITVGDSVWVDDHVVICCLQCGTCCYDTEALREDTKCDWQNPLSTWWWLTAMCHAEVLSVAQDTSARVCANKLCLYSTLLLAAFVNINQEVYSYSSEMEMQSSHWW